MGKVEAPKQCQIGRLATLMVQSKHHNVGRRLTERLEHRVRFERTGTKPKCWAAAHSGSQ